MLYSFLGEYIFSSSGDTKEQKFKKIDCSIVHMVIQVLILNIANFKNLQNEHGPQAISSSNLNVQIWSN